MIDITLKQLDASYKSLGELAQLHLPAKTSYRLSRILASAETQYKQMTESIQKLFQKHGAEAVDNQWRLTDPEKIAAFNAELAELMTERVELWGDPLPVSMLGEAEIAPAVLISLDWLIVEDGAEKAKVANA